MHRDWTCHVETSPRQASNDKRGLERDVRTKHDHLITDQLWALHSLLSALLSAFQFPEVSTGSVFGLCEPRGPKAQYKIRNETIKIILKSTSVHMVRATGPRLPAMPSSVLWLRDLHEFAADPEPCCICTQFVAGGSDRASSSGQSCTELPVHCSICRLHTHVSCAAQLTAADLHAILLAMLESAPPLPPMPISLANTCGHNDSHQGLRTVLASLHFFIQDRLPDVPVCAWCLALAGSALSKAADRMGQHP